MAPYDWLIVPGGHPDYPDTLKTAIRRVLLEMGALLEHAYLPKSFDIPQHWYEGRHDVSGGGGGGGNCKLVQYT